MWTCAKCGTQVEDGFDVCWQCGTSREGVEDPTFVRADDAGPIGDAGSDLQGGDPGAPAPAVVSAEGLVPCYQALSLIEAKFVAERLESEGIRAVSDAYDLQDAIGAWSGNPRVYVREEDLGRARSWLEEYDRRRKAELERDPESRLEG